MACVCAPHLQLPSGVENGTRGHHLALVEHTQRRSQAACTHPAHTRYQCMVQPPSAYKSEACTHTHAHAHIQSCRVHRRGRRPGMLRYSLHALKGLLKKHRVGPRAKVRLRPKCFLIFAGGAASSLPDIVQ